MLFRSVVKKLAASQGLSMNVEQFAPGGETLKRHLENGELLKEIEKGDWDFVVIQEQSVAPALPKEEVEANTFKAAKVLDSLIVANNPNVEVIYYMTWAHKYGLKKANEEYPYLKTYEGMQAIIAERYFELAKLLDGKVAPVGIAWNTVRKEEPDIELYMPDNRHPSKQGTYLAANVIFSILYGKHYVSSYRMGLPIDTAQYLQNIAQKLSIDSI